MDWKADIDSNDFGQRLPPLYVEIKEVLQEYPDGQVFKVRGSCSSASTVELPVWYQCASPGVLSETLYMYRPTYMDRVSTLLQEIIQNADDAGARTVRFYLDSRQHGTQSLVHPELARFQGPALLAYNDAQFTADDWEGIQNFKVSGKAKDPFKVGKFGIGFNSVYHVTGRPDYKLNNGPPFLCVCACVRVCVGGGGGGGGGGGRGTVNGIEAAFDYKIWLAHKCISSSQIFPLSSVGQH